MPGSYDIPGYTPPGIQKLEIGNASIRLTNLDHDFDLKVTDLKVWYVHIPTETAEFSFHGMTISKPVSPAHFEVKEAVFRLDCRQLMPVCRMYHAETIEYSLEFMSRSYSSFTADEYRRLKERLFFDCTVSFDGGDLPIHGITMRSGPLRVEKDFVLYATPEWSEMILQSRV